MNETLIQNQEHASEKSAQGLIYTLIPRIMKGVGAIPKTKKPGAGVSYAFRGIDDLYLALQGLLASEGVFFTPVVLSQKREERESKSGGSLTITILEIRYRFFAIDGSYIDAVTIGEAMDVSDKSSNKAMSAALKYALLQIFCIPTEEEKDTEFQSHEAKPKTQSTKTTPGPSEAQLKRLFAISKKSNWSHDDVKSYLRTSLGIDSTKDLTYPQYDNLCKYMEAMPKERNEGSNAS